MRKFSTVFKEKQNESIKLHENRVLGDFKTIYKKLLENYNSTSFDKLSDESKRAFTGELSEYWTETNGISEKGAKFVNDNCSALTENSTSSQKKNYLKKKISCVIDESIRQYDLKFKIYDVLDEMYGQVKAEDIAEVLKPKIISEIISSCFNESISEFVRNISHELNESSAKG